MKSTYYNLLEQLSWRTIKRFKPLNKFTKASQINIDGGESINKEISERIKIGSPLMIARYGSIELSAISNVISYRKKENILTDSFKFLLGLNSQFWEINQTKYDNLCKSAGFFPEDNIQLLNKFTDLMLESSKELDILGVWVGLEDQIPTISKDTLLTGIRRLEPWFYNDPWSYNLKGKKVLVIHPFEESIRKQYEKREYLFENKKILPEFELKTIKAVQTIAGNKNTDFKDWFEALDSMKKKIDKIDFDIAIIGCGAYGFPLASYVKTLGKQAIHLGGMVQWLFGIKGQRWLNFENYKKMPNEHWVFPSREEKPKGFEKVEGGCYW